MNSIPENNKWWPTSNELVFLDYVVDPRANLAAYSPVPCDDHHHANELAICVLTSDWKCHYPGCQSEITARKVNERMQAYIHSKFNRGELSTYDYDADELKRKMAAKVERIKIGLEIVKRFLASLDDAPPEEEVYMHRILQKEAQELRAEKCKKIKNKIILATFISLVAIFWLNIISNPKYIQQ